MLFICLELLALLQNRPLFQAICPGSLWARDNRWLLSRVQRLAGPVGGHGPFIPVGGTNRDKRVAFYPDWWLQPGQKARAAFCPGWSHQPGQKAGWCLQPGQKVLASLSSSLSPRLSHSAHLFLTVLGSGGGVLAHFFTTFVKIFDSPSIHRR